MLITHLLSVFQEVSVFTLFCLPRVSPTLRVLFSFYGHVPADDVPEIMYLSSIWTPKMLGLRAWGHRNPVLSRQSRTSFNVCVLARRQGKWEWLTLSSLVGTLFPCYFRSRNESRFLLTHLKWKKTTKTTLLFSSCDGVSLWCIIPKRRIYPGQKRRLIDFMFVTCLNGVALLPFFCIFSTFRSSSFPFSLITFLGTEAKSYSLPVNRQSSLPPSSFHSR